MPAHSDSRTPVPTSLLALAYLAFVSLGLPDTVLGVAWPSLRDSLGLPQAMLGGLLAPGAAAYVLAGALAGRLIRALEVGWLLVASTGLVCAGVFGFCVAPTLPWLLLAATLVGFGSGAIDSALNAYAAREFSGKHVSWMHAAYGVGATLGPSLLAAVLVRGGSWRMGYGVLGGILAALALVFVPTRHRWASLEVPAVRRRGSSPSGAAPWLQLAVFFLYTGVEAGVGQWGYTLLTEARGFTAAAAGTWISAYWGGLLLGRVVLGVAIERVGHVRLLRWATVGACAAAAVFALPVHASVLALPLISFCLAPIFPGLMALTPKRFGDHAALDLAGYQVSAGIVGVALLPGAAGLLGARVGLEAIPAFLAVCAFALVAVHEVLVRRADPERGDSGAEPHLR